MADVQSDYNILKGTLDLIGIKYSTISSTEKDKIQGKMIIIANGVTGAILEFTKDGMYAGGL